MKINLVQYNPVWEEKAKNREKLLKLVSESHADGSLLIFPELTLTGFTMKSDVFSEELNGESFRFFSQVAVERNTNVIAGIIEKENSSYYNTLLHIDTLGEIKSKYRKIHPFSYSTENKYYARGEKTVVTEMDGWKAGLSICYDLRFPELYRQYGKEKAHLIIVIANWPDTRIEHWKVLLRARAIENQCYVAGVNRMGDDLKLHYNGFSGIYDPMGVEIASATDKETVISAEISREKVEEIRHKFPFLDDIYLF